MVTDLTTGKPGRVLLNFTIPMFISVIFQQMYSLADSIIAGKFAGENALAAVGASYPITMIFMAIALGCNVGCSVVISQLFGAKRFTQMKTAISTTIIASLGVSLVLTAFGLLFCNPLMRLIHTPANIFEDSALYLRIYVAGLVFVFLYNVATGVFTSLGDSKSPLYFLIGLSVGNIVLDYIFVRFLKMGVAGVAWATFIAQGLACILALFTLLKRYRAIESKQIPDRFSWVMFRTISIVAIPSILQQSFVSVGNMFVQGLINSYGSSVIAGYSAAMKLNTFGITAFGTLGNAMSSFTAQNIGAGKHDRIQKGYKADSAIAIGIALLFFAAYFILPDQFMGLFLNSDSSQALSTGRQFLRIVSPFYVVVCMKLVTDGVLRGAGAMLCFMTTTFSDLILRVVLAFILSFAMHSEVGIWLSWPIGWTIGTALSLYFYFTKKWKRKSLA